MVWREQSVGLGSYGFASTFDFTSIGFTSDLLAPARGNYYFNFDFGSSQTIEIASSNAIRIQENKNCFCSQGSPRRAVQRSLLSGRFVAS